MNEDRIYHIDFKDLIMFADDTIFEFELGVDDARVFEKLYQRKYESGEIMTFYINYPVT